MPLTSVGMLCWQSMMLHHSGCRAAKLGQAVPVRSALYRCSPNLAACTISTILHRQAMMFILLHSSVGADALSVGIVGGGPSGASFAGRLREAFGSAAEITVFEATRGTWAGRRRHW